MAWRARVCLGRVGRGGGLCSLVTAAAVPAAPGRDGAEAWARGAEARLFLDRPDFFDYPDSDRARQLAVARFIGEKPVVFDRPGRSSLRGAPV